MALIKCNECGGMVSDKATSCPHCSNPINVSPAGSPGNPTEVPGADVTPSAESKPQGKVTTLPMKKPLVIALAAVAVVVVVAVVLVLGRDAGSGSGSAGNEDTIAVEVGEQVDTDLYSFKVTGSRMLTEGENDFYSKESLEDADSREYQVTVVTASNSSYDYDRFGFGVEDSYILINGEYKYYNDGSRGSTARAMGSGTAKYAFMVPERVAESVESIEFHYIFNNQPGDGGDLIATMTADGFEMHVDQSSEQSHYVIKLK